MRIFYHVSVRAQEQIGRNSFFQKNKLQIRKVNSYSELNTVFSDEEKPKIWVIVGIGFRYPILYKDLLLCCPFLGQFAVGRVTPDFRKEIHFCPAADSPCGRMPGRVRPFSSWKEERAVGCHAVGCPLPRNKSAAPTLWRVRRVSVGWVTSDFDFCHILLVGVIVLAKPVANKSAEMVFSVHPYLMLRKAVRAPTHDAE